MVALLASMLRKRTRLPTLGILYGTGGEENLASVLANTITAASALTYLVIQMLFDLVLAPWQPSNRKPVGNGPS